jgi:DNA-binding response OmpR family regulator
LMALRADRTCSRDLILVAANSDGTPETVDVQLSRVRQTLRQSGAPTPFRTVRGEGYRWFNPISQGA